MTDLRQLMHQTVEHERADMVQLATRARRRGTTMRRHRRLATTVGSLAAVAVVGVGFAAAGGAPLGGDDAREATVAADQGATIAPKVEAPSDWQPAPDCSDLRADLTYTPVPEAGRVLKAAVASVAQGTISEVSGTRSSATCHHPEMVSGSLVFAPADGSADVQVSVSFMRPTSAEAPVSSCDGNIGDNCEVTTLADGTTLRTYSMTQPSGGVETTWQIAERLVDDYVVNVQAIGEVPLTRDQVAAIAPQLSVIK